MKLLVVGSGGREHALAAALRRDRPGATIWCAPGNPGTAGIAENVPFGTDDLAGLASFAEERDVDLTVVGPEAPLARGIADLFAGRDLPLFGPTRAAARLESSKAFAHRLMAKHDIPTAAFETFTDAEDAREHVRGRGAPIVVKASGLAGGKGSFVCATVEEAEEAIRVTLEEGRFGEAGREIVIEEFMEGRELSVFYLTDGRAAVPLLASRDHKRLEEGGRGPNTGGMGAYAPVADATPELMERVQREIVGPVLEGMAEEGAPYRGFLYAGLMLTGAGPRVVEFNCRLGDPEAQVVLPLTRSSLIEPMEAIARGAPIGDWRPELEEGAALVTILASGGYPGNYETGHPITIPEDLASDRVRIFHAGTERRDGRLVTAGGRVLGVTGLGAEIEEAAERSRAGAERIRFRDRHWRSDIGRDVV